MEFHIYHKGPESQKNYLVFFKRTVWISFILCLYLIVNYMNWVKISCEFTGGSVTAPMDIMHSTCESPWSKRCPLNHLEHLQTAVRRLCTEMRPDAHWGHVAESISNKNWHVWAQPELIWVSFLFQRKYIPLRSDPDSQNASYKPRGSAAPSGGSIKNRCIKNFHGAKRALEGKRW